MRDDLISRKAAIAIMCRAIHYNYEEGYAVDQMLALPSAQPEQGSEVVFWKKRAKEYEDVILKFVAEQAKDIKIDSIEISEKHIVFKSSQPERKVGKWIECESSEHWKCNQSRR